MADHVRLDKCVPAEDVIDGFESGGAIDVVPCGIVGGGYDLEVVEVIACGSP